MGKIKFDNLADVPREIIEKVGRFVSNPSGNTFVIHGLPPELTGGIFARYSRAPTGLVLTLINEFLDENGEPSAVKGQKIMDRVLNAFGDDSVGELEGTHAGIENVSQLVINTVEGRRIGGSPIEKSTRYVKMDKKDERGRWAYHRPQEVILAGSALLARYEHAMDRAFETYAHVIEQLTPHFQQIMTRENFTIKVSRTDSTIDAHEHELTSQEEQRAFTNAYNFTIRCAALDVGRCVLPASALSNFGVYGNGRYWTTVLNALKSSELAEERDRGDKLEEALATVIPTFIQRNRADPAVAQLNTRMRKIAEELFYGIEPTRDFVTLVDRAEIFDEVIASALFPFTTISLPQILTVVEQLPYERKMEILQAYTGKRASRRDRTGRGAEAGYPYTFDLMGGIAEFRDLKRHRMCTFQYQPWTVDHGFIMPPEMGLIGLERDVEEAVGQMEDLYSEMNHAGITSALQYATLFNHRARWLMGMNAREAQHLLELRSQPAGHHSYRRMSMDMADAIKEREPWMASVIGHVNYADPDNRISRAREQSKIAGGNLKKGIDGAVDLQ